VDSNKQKDQIFGTSSVDYFPDKETKVAVSKPTDRRLS
jgi:hypothetical protein